MKPIFPLFIVLSIFLAGCDLAKPQKPLTQPEPVAVPQPAAEPAPQPVDEPKAPVEPETVVVEAKAGVTGKGQYGQGGGEKAMDIITVPVGEYWRTKERVVFDIQIPQAMNLYKAANDDKGPESNEAFMKDIIEANMIALPKLPEGHEYFYDPATQKLMVRKPK